MMQVQSRLPSYFRRFLKALHQHIIIVLVALFAIGMGVALSGMSQLSTMLIDAQAQQNAQLLAQSLNQARSHFNESVTQRLKDIPEIQTIPNYREVEQAIPPPATFVIELGEILSQTDRNYQIRLYSRYPFPGRRATGGPQDLFEKNAIAYLEQHPQGTFTAKEKRSHHQVFRYAEAVTMQPSCVDCHNTLANSPKRNWQVGDVRGVVSVTQPLDAALILSRNGIHHLLVSLSTLGGLALTGILFVFSRLRTLNHELNAKVRAQTTTLRKLASIDELTQVHNRRHFNTALAQAWSSAIQTQQPLTLILCDVDYFKKYNDTYGHQAGDRCLAAIAEILTNSTRQSDILVARYGGEEFVLLLPDTSADAAIIVAKRLQTNLKAANLPHKSSLVTPQVTLSLGITTLLPQKHQHPDCLVSLADQALYRAKAKGRNCYTIQSA